MEEERERERGRQASGRGTECMRVDVGLVAAGSTIMS